MSRYSSIVFLVLACWVLPAQAQDEELADLLREVGETYSEPYLQPMANALGAGMNTGLFHTARVGGGMLPLIDIYAGVKVMGALVPSSDRTMSLVYETEKTFEIEGNNYVVPVTFEIDEAPTVFGDRRRGQALAHVDETFAGPDDQLGTEDDVVIDSTVTLSLLPGLIDTPIAPFFVPHFGIGSFMGTDLTIRYLPRIGYQDYGSVGFVGIGARHSISQYIPLFPISLSAQLMWQKLSIEDGDDNEVFAASALAGNVVASKSLLVLTVYGGLQAERSSVDISYTFDPGIEDVEPQQVEFGLRGDNVVRAVAGFAVNMGPVLVNLDAAVGNTTIVSGGLGVSL